MHRMLLVSLLTMMFAGCNTHTQELTKPAADCTVTTVTSPASTPIKEQNISFEKWFTMVDHSQLLSPSERQKRIEHLRQFSTIKPYKNLQLAILHYHPNATKSDLSKARQYLRIMQSEEPKKSEMYAFSRIIAKMVRAKLELVNLTTTMDQKLTRSQRNNQELERKLNALLDIDSNLAVDSNAPENEDFNNDTP